jgi:NTE family protein
MSVRAVVFVLLCLAPYACFGEDQIALSSHFSQAEAERHAARRPTIGVALEGGGALGEAHIGVLKWFEEHHIPIDYLAGTSMGGLVGGLYATGRSADDLQRIVKTANWPLLLVGETPYQDLSFRRKEDARQIPNSLMIGLKHGATLPPGLNTGHQVNLLIDRETLPYSNIKSFDDLPIPFRCVATEIVSGKPYVFHNGSLSDAMRATMSIPGVFVPVRHGNQILVDGGLVDNLPTDVIRKMGADVVIAIHLQISPTSAKEIQSAFSILGRSVAIVIAETEIRGMADSDIIVKANVEKFSSMDYEKSDELIKIGYEAAEQKAAVLKPYALDDAAWAAYLAEKQSRVRTQIGIPQFVRVTGVEGEAAASVTKLLAPLAGKPINEPQLEQLLTQLTGTGRYESVTYDLINDANGRQGLLIRVHEKTYAPPTLQPAFQVDGTQPSDVTLTLGGRLTVMDIAGFRSEWRTDFEFGGTYGIASDLYRPIRPFGKWFLDPFVNASQTTLSLYDHLDPKSIYSLVEVYGGIDFGYAFNRYSEVRLGYQYGYESGSLRLGRPEFVSFDGTVGAVRARYVLDHTNDPVIPTDGYYLRSNFRYFNEFVNTGHAFPTLDLTLQYFRPVLHHRDSAFVIAEGGSTLGYQPYGITPFFLGAANHLSAYGLNELFGNQYFLGRVGYLRHIFTPPPFIGKKVYFTLQGEVGKMYGDPLGAPRLSADGVLGVITSTAFGPVFIGAAAGDTGHHKWLFQLGRVF